MRSRSASFKRRATSPLESKTVCPRALRRWLALLCASKGCSGEPSRSSPQEDEPWDSPQKYSSGSKSPKRNAVGIADGERGGEVRYLGKIDASEENMRRFVKWMAAKYERLHFC